MSKSDGILHMRIGRGLKRKLTQEAEARGVELSALVRAILQVHSDETIEYLGWQEATRAVIQLIRAEHVEVPRAGDVRQARDLGPPRAAFLAVGEDHQSFGQVLGNRHRSRNVTRPGIISKALGRSRQRRKEPMDVILTLKINFGNSPSDAMTLIEERKVPLVGSVFENRDRIAREFLRLLLKAGASQPRLLRNMLSGKAP